MKSFLPFGFLLSFLFSCSPTFFFFGKSYKDSVKCAHNALSKKSIISLKHCQNNYFAFAISWHHHPLAEQNECSPVRALWSSRRPGCRSGPITSLSTPSHPPSGRGQGPSPHSPLPPGPIRTGVRAHHLTVHSLPSPIRTGTGPITSLSTPSHPPSRTGVRAHHLTLHSLLAPSGRGSGPITSVSTPSHPPSGRGRSEGAHV